MTKRRPSPGDQDWFGAEIIRRLDRAIVEWARRRRPPGSARSRPRDLDEALGDHREWWQRIRSGRRRRDSGLTLGQIQSMCDVMGLEPEDIVGRPTPLAALRALAAGARPKPRRREPLLDAALRLRREGKLDDAAECLVRVLEEEPTAEGWIHASYLLGSAGRVQDAMGAATEALLHATLASEKRGQGRSLLALANAYFAAASYERADAAYVAAASFTAQLSSVDLCSLHQGRGKTLWKLGLLDEAGIALQRAIESASTPGQRSFLWWLAGDLHRELGHPTAALEAYRQAFDLSEGARPEVSAVDRAHLLTVVAVTAYEANEERIARTLMPTALALLSELSRASPEAQAVLAAAHAAAARGERLAAWKQAAKAFERIRRSGVEESPPRE